VVNQDLLDYRDHKEQQAHLDNPVRLDQKETVESLVSPVATDYVDRKG